MAILFQVVFTIVCLYHWVKMYLFPFFIVRKFYPYVCFYFITWMLICFNLALHHFYLIKHIYIHTLHNRLYIFCYYCFLSFYVLSVDDLCLTFTFCYKIHNMKSDENSDILFEVSYTFYFVLVW